MTDRRDPSYADLVYEVLRSTGRPLTFQEIFDRVNERRPITTRNPKGTIRGTLTGGRQLVNLGDGRYGYLPQVIKGSLLQLPLTERQPASDDEANAMIQELLAGGGVPPRNAVTPLEQAQELLYDAWETSSSRERIRLARRALTILSDCADAHVLLAEETARSPEEAAEQMAAWRVTPSALIWLDSGPR
jgi:hypothetical protein